MQQNHKDQSAKNKASAAFLNKKKKVLEVDQLVAGVAAGDRLSLAKAITLIESTARNKQQVAYELIEKLPNPTKNSIRIGISGPPGVGKSTFIESFGSFLTKKGLKIAVLAIDPSSQKTKGSILGDKTRMDKLSSDPLAFIRPSPAGKKLGGVAAKTQETIHLIEAAGFDLTIIETVGVGQSELEVYSMVDCFLLLLQPGGGDELQGIKKGVVEMADIIAVNKSDGETKDLAQQTRLSYKNALHLFPANPNGWTTKVLKVSALEEQGISDVWESIQEFTTLCQENGHFDQRRMSQSKEWFQKHLNQMVLEKIEDDQALKTAYKEQLAAIEARETSPIQAAKEVFKKYSETPSK